MDNMSDVLMLSGVAAVCVDCGGERIFVPVDEASFGDGPSTGSGQPCEFCCTSCDAAVFRLELIDRTAEARSAVA